MKITISKNTFLKTGLLILINCFAILVSAQKPKKDIINILGNKNISISQTNNYIAVLPINGCFNCVKEREYEINQIKKGAIVIVYPSARKVVQESIKKDFTKKISQVTFVFDNELYNQLCDKNSTKGYILKLN
jgi:hypothetical protein